MKATSKMDDFPTSRVQQQVAEMVKKHGDEAEDILSDYGGMIDETPTKGFNQFSPDPYTSGPNAGKYGIDVHYDKHVRGIGPNAKMEFGDITKDRYLEIASETCQKADIKVVYNRGGQLQYGFYDSTQNIFTTTTKNGDIITCFKPSTEINKCANNLEYILGTATNPGAGSIGNDILQYAGTAGKTL